MAFSLTRRNRAHGAGNANSTNAQPMQAPLIAHHSHVGLARGTGSRGSGRNRRRGSPFAALSDAYKPSRVMFSPFSGRDGGEVVALRSGNRGAWPAPLERVTADPRHLQQQQQQDRSSSSVPSLSSPRALRSADHNAAGQGREVVVGGEEEVVVVREDDVACGGRRESEVSRSVPPSASSTSSSPTTTATSTTTAAARSSSTVSVSSSSSSSAGARAGRRPTLRRRVTWACKVETVVEVTRTASCDVFSPDLHSLQIAKRLAVLADEPELARAAEAVSIVRRQAAVAIRSLTSRHGWNGSLDGLEEASRLWAGRELTYMNETDELVRLLSPRSGRRGAAAGADGWSASGDGGGDGDVWSLKAAYRTARRRMKDADSD